MSSSSEEMKTSREPSARDQSSKRSNSKESSKSKDSQDTEKKIAITMDWYLFENKMRSNINFNF